MKSFSRGLVLSAGLLASSAAFVSSCTVDGNGLAVVDDDAGADGSEPDGTPPANADGGDATIDSGALADAQDGSLADGTVTPGADAEAGTGDAGDAAVATDSAVDAWADAGTDGAVGDASGGPDADAAIDGGSPPADAAGDVVAPEDAADDGGDAGVDASADAGGDAALSATTVSVITDALGSVCAYAAMNDNCLPTQCEDLTGSTGSSTNTSLCLATLACALSNSTATTYCGMRVDTVDECYCGDHNFTDCQNGQSNGVCITAEQAGFGSNDPGTITSSYLDTTTASGLANTIASCLNGVAPCVSASGI